MSRLSCNGSKGAVCYHTERLLTTNHLHCESDLNKPLLGHPTMDLVQRINSIGMKEFPSLFNGQGKMTGDYTIRLRDDAKHFVPTTPRRIAVPPHQKVKEELQRMESLGVIERVTQPTDWCAGMVVVQKTNGRTHATLKKASTIENEEAYRRNYNIMKAEMEKKADGYSDVRAKVKCY